MMAARLVMRNYSLLEHQAKKFLRDSGVLVQRGSVGSSKSECESIASSLLPPYIVKANVPVGGRGKGHLSSGLKGGVQFCSTPPSVGEVASKMLGFKLFTKQTSSEGIQVDNLLVLEEVNIQQQKYLAFVLDRQMGGAAVIYSKEGGMEIEEVAEKNPESVLIEPIQSISNEKAEKIVRKLEIPENHIPQAKKDLIRLYEIFRSKDAVQLEINPWAVTPAGVYCVDAKINIDDNAIFKHPEIQEFKAESEKGQMSSEIEAEKNGLNFVGLSGNIGCIVNGAGLAMATMDLIKLKGGAPANFLDLGGGANEKQIFKAFEILFGNTGLKSVFVNIFGGIVRCDVIAKCLVKAKDEIGFPCPVVVRLQGTNADLAQEIINGSSSEKLFSDINSESAAALAVRLSL
jgi:succinyl-CoA synthetase beta subunit